MRTRSLSLLPAVFAATLAFSALSANARTPQDPALSPAPVTQTAPQVTHPKKKRHVRQPATVEAVPTEPGAIPPDRVHPITSLPKAPGDTSVSSGDYVPSSTYAPAPGTAAPAGTPTSIVPLSEGSTVVTPPAAAPTPATSAPAVTYTQPGQGTPPAPLPSAPAPSAPVPSAPIVPYAQPGQTPPAAAAPAYVAPAPQAVNVGPPPAQVTYTEAPMPEEPRYVRKPHVRPFSAIAVQVKAGFAGIGVDIATPLAQRFNLRVGGSFFSYNGTYNSDGLQISGDANFRSGSAAIDIFPFNNGFRISPGITFYNGNNFNAKIFVPPGSTYDPGDGSPSVSDPTGVDPIRGTAIMSFGKKYAPSLTIGWGNMIPRSGKHLSFPFEIGAQYIDNPSMALTLIGTSCDPGGQGCEDIRTDPIAQQNVQEEQADINSALHSYLRFYPIISFGVAWRFGSWK